MVKKGSLEKLVKFAEKTKDAGAIGARLQNPDGSDQTSAYYLPTVGRALIHYWFNGKKYFDKYIPGLEKPEEVEALTMAAFMITPKALEMAGILNDRYFMYFEDLDYARELKKAGLKLYYMTSATFVHEHGASGKHLSNESNQWR